MEARTMAPQVDYGRISKVSPPGAGIKLSQTVASAIERASELNGRLNQLASDAERHAARLGGERPSPAGVLETGADSLNGQVPMLHAALDMAFDLTDRLRYALGRLDEV